MTIRTRGDRSPPLKTLKIAATWRLGPELLPVCVLLTRGGSENILLTPRKLRSLEVFPELINVNGRQVVTDWDLIIALACG